MDSFCAACKRLRIDDEALRQIEWALLQQPQIGPVMSGTDGVRKFRFARKGEGKSGGYRICYAILHDTVILLVIAFAKNEQANLTSAQKQQLREVVARLRKAIKR